MPLTDTSVKNAKPSNKTYKKYDEKGLYLEISPAGGKWWRFKYRFDDKEKRISLGIYPDISLKEARTRRDEARNLVANGIDPSEKRKAVKISKFTSSENSFEAIAREWFESQKSSWTDSHSSKIIKRFENDVFPWIGSKPISEISAQELLICLRRIENRGAGDTAHRAHQNCGQVFRYAIQTERATVNPSENLRGALSPVKKEHYASITNPKEVGELLRAFDGFRGTLIVQTALKLSPLVFLRPGELRKTEWVEIDFDKCELNVPGPRMKMRLPHLVHLSKQAVFLLKELHALTGKGRFVFPGAHSKDRSMSEAAVNAALRRMGYDTKNEITGHGFRAMARTILHEQLGFKPEVIEHQLAHRVPDALGTAYNRTKFLAERKKMMQTWADYLDKLKAEANAPQ